MKQLILLYVLLLPLLSGQAQTFDPTGFEFSMTIVGTLNIEGEPSADTQDRVQAFVNGELRGETNVVLVEGEYVFYLTVWSNSVSGDEVNFKVTDASTGMDYDIVKTVSFSNGASVGGEDAFVLYTNILEYQLKAFNFFSPNGDGINDIWEVDNVDAVADLTLNIYSTNGTLVFNMVSYNNTWDGKYKNEFLPDGTYVYLFINSANKVIYNGAITILKQ